MAFSKIIPLWMGVVLEGGFSLRAVFHSSPTNSADFRRQREDGSGRVRDSARPSVPLEVAACRSASAQIPRRIQDAEVPGSPAPVALTGDGAQRRAGT